MAEQQHGEHKISLFDYLISIDGERMIVEQQWILLRRHVFEVPWFFLQEMIVLRCDLQTFIVRHIHEIGSPLPIVHFRGLEPGFVLQRRE